MTAVRQELATDSAAVPDRRREEALPARLRKPRLRRSEACEYLADVHGIEVAVATMAKWASQGTGPAYSTLHRTPLYARTDLDEWVAVHLKPCRPR